MSESLENHRKNPDKYDYAMEHLEDHPDAVGPAWGRPHDEIEYGGEIFDVGCLFSYCTPTSRPTGSCGCLTQVKRGGTEAWTSEITEGIRADTRIPLDEDSIDPRDTEWAAEWQRYFDSIWEGRGVVYEKPLPMPTG